ncbi:sigma-70 family RNA polymerase sigma factor [bacterium]|nr:sigma-70 family RNA polymerase sigma factor [bacterium]
MSDDLSGCRDDELMAWLAAGNTEALNHLVERYQGPVYNFLLRYLRDPATAEAATAEAFYRCWRHAKTYKPGGANRFRTWIFTIARNQAMTLVGRQMRGPGSLQGVFHNEDMSPPEPPDMVSPGPDTTAFQDQRSSRMAAAIQALPDLLREAILLAIEPDLSYADIAEILHCTVPAVKARVHKARLRLRRTMAGWTE